MCDEEGTKRWRRQKRCIATNEERNLLLLLLVREREREKEEKGKLRNGEEGGAIEVVVGCSFSLVRTMQRASNEAESRYATYSNTIPTVWQVGSLPLEV